MGEGRREGMEGLTIDGLLQVSQKMEKRYIVKARGDSWIKEGFLRIREI